MTEINFCKASYWGFARIEDELNSAGIAFHGMSYDDYSKCGFVSLVDEKDYERAAAIVAEYTELED